MTFLNPLLLVAALGIGLPILAHLLNRFQVRHTDWAAMRFLNRSIRVRSTQLRLRDFILLLLRCLAILLLVLAVSKPALEKAQGLMGRFGDKQPGVVIAIDASFSMQHGEGDTTRFDRALEKVREIARDIPEGAPVSLVLLGDEHEVLARNMAFDSVRFETLLEGMKAGSGRLRLETVPATLAGLVSEMDAVRREVHLITDLQQGDWADSPRWLQDGLTSLQADAETFIIPVTGGPENLAVTEFELFSGLLRKGTTARYSATVHNFGMAPVTGTKVNCLMGDNVIDTKIIPSIGAQSSQTVSFFVPFYNAGQVQLAAQVDDGALEVDNVRRTVANIGERVSILCVEGPSGARGIEGFMAKALQARDGDAGEEDFQVRSVSWLSLPSQDLTPFDVVVLSDVPELTEQKAQELRDHIKAGNGLIWFGGENVKAAVWNQRSAMEGGALLPASLSEAAGVGDRLETGRPIDPVFLNHPVCRPLRSLPKDLLSETEFFRVSDVEPLPSGSAILNLSGSATPVLLEQSLGRGHVFMFTTTADPVWNNMALTPVFPMLVQQMATYLTGREFERSRTVGGSLALSYADRPDANDGVFETPSGEVVRVPVREHVDEFVAFLDRAGEPGFYLAKVSLQSPGQPIAVNVDTRESEVRCMELADAGTALAGTGVTVDAEGGALAVDGREGRDYWRALLLAGLVVLLVESLLAFNIFGGRKEQGSEPETPAGAKEA